ncbi:hypothetical protein M2150_001529 [Lachnospiraceae bacterium PM6-15]|uniref:hypothetical protein n=1 Tax=Ohessyouella blattaphilus TaxID=2949333 RepID=UPI003E1C299C
MIKSGGKLSPSSCPGTSPRLRKLLFVWHLCWWQSRVLCGLINFEDWLRQAPWHFKLLPPIRKAFNSYLGGNPKKEPKLMHQTSADGRIAPNPPAFYIQHGDKYTAVPVQQAIVFYEKLKASGYFKEDDLVLDILLGSPHAGAGPEYLEPKNVMPIIEFFKKQIAKK